MVRILLHIGSPQHTTSNEVVVVPPTSAFSIGLPMQELTALALPRALLLVEDSGAIDPDVARELEASLRPLSHQPDVRDVVVALLDRASLFSLAASWDN